MLVHDHARSGIHALLLSRMPHHIEPVTAGIGPKERCVHSSHTDAIKGTADAQNLRLTVPDNVGIYGQEKREVTAFI